MRLLCSAEAAPADLFENVITQAEAAGKPQLKDRFDTVVDDNLGFSNASINGVWNWPAGKGFSVEDLTYAPVFYSIVLDNLGFSQASCQG